MLDNETKRRIDTARDILVGKVPDPKSQVEQITIALIYKFMDDMDSEAEELGGESSFFSGEYDKYGWRKIFNPGMGGFEMLSLYSEAILKMAQNPNLPQLFRDIFKNAYLPYRDPETLKSFLKIIDDFSYDHSEKLGDAFEYLLSILGSQGDAGQFRTPRHIIDFMTSIIDPRKTDVLLDPACGTAGFLISAFKHILKANSSNYDFATDKHAFEQHGIKLDELTINGKKYKGDKLTPDERARIINSIRGYDISPDMVRLSLVNLYLHGFTDPHIFEYDTLTSEDRWNEYVDVILANPPFMSPKGGIRPHKRFSIQSNRSEVLFVDYMVEHLTPTGRAAIIVPEGVIFQSGTAYKSLRKMLVDENYLVGIISLPAGLFNPYSGVKTSILWIDKSLARKTDKILFAKITADGFDLGAQRRPVKQNDLPDAFRAIKQYIDFLQSGSIPVGPIHDDDFHDDDFVWSLRDNNDDFVRSLHATTPPDAAIVGTLQTGTLQMDAFAVGTLHATFLQQTPAPQSIESTLQSIYPNISLVSKSDIAENGDYNLSGERYKITSAINSDFPIVNLSLIAEVIAGQSPSGENYNENGNGLPFYQGKTEFGDIYIGEPRKWTTQITKQAFEGDILMSVRAPVGPVNIATQNICIGRGIAAIRPNHSIKKEYLFYLLRSKEEDIKGNGGAVFDNITRTQIEELQIPLPPLSIQQEIVTEIESYQQIIDGARQVVENYKPRITINPDWEMVELGAVCEKITDGTHRTPQYAEKGIPFLRVTDITESNDSKKFISKEEHQELIKRCNPEKGDILYSKNGTIGVAKLVEWDYEFSIFVSLALLKPKKKIIFSNYLAHLMNSVFVYEQATSHSKSGTITNLHLIEIKQFKIPLPPLETQHQIVSQIEREQALVNANKELIRLFEQKVKDRIARVWGEDMPKAYPEPAEELAQVAEPNK